MFVHQGRAQRQGSVVSRYGHDGSSFVLVLAGAIARGGDDDFAADVPVHGVSQGDGGGARGSRTG